MRLHCLALNTFETHTIGKENLESEERHHDLERVETTGSNQLMTLQCPDLTHRTTVFLPHSPIHVIAQEDEAHAQTAVRFPIREPVQDPQ